MINRDDARNGQVSPAASEATASKQFTIDPSGSRVELKSGAQGFRRRGIRVRAYRSDGNPQPVVYIGDANVTSSNGYALYLLDEIVLFVDDSVAVYATSVFSGGDQIPEVDILEFQ